AAALPQAGLRPAERVHRRTGQTARGAGRRVRVDDPAVASAQPEPRQGGGPPVRRRGAVVRGARAGPADLGVKRDAGPVARDATIVAGGATVPPGGQPRGAGAGARPSAAGAARSGGGGGARVAADGDEAPAEREQGQGAEDDLRVPGEEPR